MIFFLATFAFTWTAWSVAATIPAGAEAGPGASALRSALFLLGTFSPAIVALILTARARGAAGVRALVGRIGRWDVNGRWYLFAVGFIMAIKLTAALVYRATTGAWPAFGDTPVILMIMALAISTWVQAGEELGWRGYALPRLAAKLGLGPASVLLGVIWASWHLPLFVVPAADTYHQSFPVYLLQVTAISVAIAWLYWRTGGSLLLPMLFHAAGNNTKDIVPSISPSGASPFTFAASGIAWITVGLLWVCAGYFLFQMRGATIEAES